MILTKVQKQFCEKMRLHVQRQHKGFKWSVTKCAFALQRMFFLLSQNIFTQKHFFSLSSGSSVAQMSVLVLLLKRQKK
jgi:hypothetical protein